MIIEEFAKRMVEAQKDVNLQLGLKRSINNFSRMVAKVLDTYPNLTELAEYVKTAKEEVLNNLDYYINKTIRSIEATGAYAYFASNRDSMLKIVDKIVGKERRIIIKAKSMVTEEVMLREYLAEKGHEVYETDLGELLIQVAKEKPMHTIAPALHLTKERVAQLLKKLELPVDEKMKHEELVFHVKEFFKEKFVKADVGISGANTVAADSGSIFLVHNEGNISNVVTNPPIHIVVVSVEKIMPTFKDAMYQVIVQSGYAGLYPPTYVNIISGPSSTADIEFHRIYGVHGAREVHVILYDGGRISALGSPVLKEQLRCIKCGRCQISCPIWNFSGNIWGGKVYGGPMGVGWTAVTEGTSNAEPLSWFCLLCNVCREVCPVRVDVAEISRLIRSQSIEKGFVPPKVRSMLENIYKHGNPLGLPRIKRSEWVEKGIPVYKPGTEFLYYVGDLGSYDPRAQKAAKAVAEVLSVAGLSFGILGVDENCSGSEAYELGEEGLFEEVAKSNITLFRKLNVEKIVTLSPHSYNVMKNHYSRFGGSFNVKHYTQLVWELIKDGKLKFRKNAGNYKIVTYHDPCFLGRWNNEYEAPRKILNSIPGVKLVEMEQNKQNALCCGGGSGSCYVGFGCSLLAEDENNPNRRRVKEAYKTGAEILVVACPSCLIMLEDAVKAEGLEEKLLVKDVAEIIVSLAI